MAEHLYAAIPELAALGDDEITADLVASAEANIRQVLWLLKRGAGVDEVTLPPEAASFMRGNVRRGIPLPSELRGYRLGHAWLWDRWMRALQERIHDPEELIAAQDVSSALIFAYVDRVSDVLVEEYGTERERMMRGATTCARRRCGRSSPGSRSTRRRCTAGWATTSGAGTWPSASRLGTSEVRGLERAAREAAAAVASGEPLIVPSGAASLDVWSGSYEAVETTRLERYEPPEGFASPSAGGRAGSRGSVGRTARRCRRRASRHSRDLGREVVGYAQVELVSLLASDLPRARDFVATQLGPLAAASEPAQRLRETLSAFLAVGGRSVRAAKELYVHQNTVAYRVKRAEELLGRRVNDEPLELHVRGSGRDTRARGDRRGTAAGGLTPAVALGQRPRGALDRAPMPVRHGRV